MANLKPLRVQGVPVHPMLVHFPIAGWTAATPLAVVAAMNADAAFMAAAWWCNVAALATGAAAMAAGFLEFLVMPDDEKLRAAVARHMLLAGSAWSAYLVMLLLQAKALDVAAALAGLVAFILLIGAGHAGARLVYHHQLPQRMRSQHE